MTAALKTGYAPLYRRGERNFCPGCGGGHWTVGRFSAECASCATALPFAPLANPRYPAWANRV